MKCILFLILICTTTQPRSFFNMFHPASARILILEASGDAMHPGRIIDGNFESSVSFTIAQKLKEALAQISPGTKVIINRTPGQAVALLQNAQLANKLSADLYISINCYAHTHAHPAISVYQFFNGDTSILKKDSIGFYYSDQAHALNASQTTAWANTLKKLLAQSPELELQGAYKLPFKPLMGIMASAIGIEIGLQSVNDIALIVTPLAQALQKILEE